jgi:hypothetical protein
VVGWWQSAACLPPCLLLRLLALHLMAMCPPRLPKLTPQAFAVLEMPLCFMILRLLLIIAAFQVRVAATAGTFVGARCQPYCSSSVCLYLDTGSAWVALGG